MCGRLFQFQPTVLEIGKKGERGDAGLVPNIREGVWVIGCTSPVMPLMCMLNYKNKLFDK